MNRLLILLADPLKTFHEKGEVKPRYYNPGNLFSEVHFISPAREDIAPSRVQSLVGEARLVVHPLGPAYGLTGVAPFGPLGRVMRTVCPHVIRAYDPGLRGSLAVLWAKRLRVPSVVSVHADLDDQRRCERRPLHRARSLLEHYALARADAVVCVSRYLEPYARRHGARHAAVIYNRVYPEQFADAGNGSAARPRGRGPLAVLSVGRLVPQKYQACLIRALRHVDARLTLIGDGTLRRALMRLAAELALDDRVEFIRAVPHTEISRHYHDADVFAIATHYEGFCIPVLEAMASGLPVVASRVGPIEELLGDSGVLVENTPEAFAGALDRLARDPGLRGRLGERARARARTMDGRLMEERERALYRALNGAAG